MDDAYPAPTIFGALWRYRWISLAIVAAAVLISLLVPLVAGDGRSAQARIVLKAPDQTGVLGIEMASESSFLRYVKQRALFVTSDEVLDGARARLGGEETVLQLRAAITADASSSGESIEINVDGPGLERSVLIANAVIAAYQERSRAEVVAATDKALETLNAQRAAIVSEAGGRPQSSPVGSAAVDAQRPGQADHPDPGGGLAVRRRGVVRGCRVAACGHESLARDSARSRRRHGRRPDARVRAGLVPRRSRSPGARCRRPHPRR
ncbi:hypothetical protein [Saccharopolyspora spinosa]|uniref:hypothetical protein n=1 Tax=Saccharopolyspora spinosa TaxID=60894 RepID=UPI00376EB91F